MRKVRISRLLILILFVVLIVIGLFFIGKSIFDLFIDNDKPINSVEPIVSETTETVSRFTMELVDYEVYKSDDVDFNFVLANFKISDTEAINYSLSSLYSDESSVNLANYQSYIDELDSLGYYVGSKNVSYNIKSDKTSDTFTIFIPYLDKEKTDITIHDAVSKKQFLINLNVNNADINDLKYTTGEESVISTQEYDINVSNAYVETSLVSNGQEYSYPSTVKIYAFVLDVIRLNDEELILEDAIFIPLGTNEENHALGSSIMSSKINNFMNRTIKEGDRGALFFEMYSPQDANISYSGTLRLKFSNSDNWLSIETELN